VFNTKLTPTQRLQKAVVDIMHKERYRALSGVLMIGEREVATTFKGRELRCPTAATDGKNEVYHPQFIAELSDAQLRFLVLHENYHKLYKHLTTWRWMYELNPTLANMACDYVINIKLVDDNPEGFAIMPPGGLLDPKYRDWDSAAVFHDLLKDSDGGGGGEGDPGGFDMHDWEGADQMSAEDKQALAREIDGAIRQGAMLAGKTGAGGDRDFEDLLQPQVDWRTALRDFVTSTCAGSDFSTWSRPNRRYIGAGHYMPSGITEQVKDLVVAIDTSGTIGGPQLTSFMSEVKAICDTVKPECVHVLYWDTRVARAEVYATHELEGLMASTKPAGGGGTIVECVPQYMAEHRIAPQATIVLTDGYLGGTWGTWSCPVLWCVLDNKSARPSHGTTVHISQASL
jgi:predicted metal-dependent peptidase